MTPHGVIEAMHLKQYLSITSKADKLKLAERCKTSVGHLKNVADGFRKPSAGLCVLLEQETKSVTRQELLANDWQGIWPELIAKKIKRQSVRVNP